MSTPSLRSPRVRGALHGRYGGYGQPMAQERARFAPSTTGPAHPGTLLAGLLCWLDARSRQARLLLRLEDLDPQRCRPEFAAALVVDLAWLGLDWDEVELQSAAHARHAAALDQLAGLGRLYPSPASRAERLQGGTQLTPYDNGERQRSLPPGGWRQCPEPLRLRLDAGVVSPCDEGGLELTQDLAVLGDPIVRRRDGAVSYQLAVVVDDAAWGVSRIVRGRDIAPSSALQMALRAILGLPEPLYRHHLLLCEARGAKLAKLHGAVALADLRPHYTAPQLCGVLAACAGLVAPGTSCTPTQLLADFSWQRVRRADCLLRWDGRLLAWTVLDASDAAP